MTDSLIRWAKERKIALACSIGFATLGVVCVITLLVEQGPPVLRISAGPEATRRHEVAKYLAHQAGRNGLTVKLSTNAGSEDCLNQLKAGQLDAAIVSNGVVVPDDDGIQVLGAVQLECMHILMRKSAANDLPAAEMVRGKHVYAGDRGSTEWLMARDFLSFTRLKLPSASHPGDVMPTSYGRAELMEKARAVLQAEGEKKDALIAELPDCLLVLDVMPSTVVQLLIEAADYQIVPLPATRAYLLDNLQDSEAKTTVIEREFLERTTIPANSYFCTHGYPAADCETVGVHLVIVARKDVPGRAIRPLMKTLFEGEVPRRILPRSPRDIATPYATHPAAAAYLDRDKPFLIKEAMEAAAKFFSVFGAFSAAALSLYGLLWRKKVRKPSDYFAEIRKVDQLARGRETDPAAPIDPQEFAEYLDNRLLQLRQDLIEDVCEGRIKGDVVIANILALLKDSRRNLPIAGVETTDHGGHLLSIGRPAKVA